MQKTEHIVRYTAEELDEILRRGGDESDWERVRALTDEEVEASIDHEDEGEFDLSRAQAGVPGLTREVSVQLDPEVVAWFQNGGPGYEERINDVLRAYIRGHQAPPAASSA
jgi:uncharacterized protein (DUF4415 family)